MGDVQIIRARPARTSAFNVKEQRIKTRKTLVNFQSASTNNEAERALRHWVIARQISQGIHTEQDTRAFGLIASVTETCRKRRKSPWPYLAEVIAEYRQGNPASFTGIGDTVRQTALGVKTVTAVFVRVCQLNI